MVDVDVRRVASYPLRGDGMLWTYLLGTVVPGVLAVLGLVIYVAGLVGPDRILRLEYPVLAAGAVLGLAWLGYFVGLARSSFDGATAPEPMRGWATTARDGLLGTLVVAVYAVPAWAVVAAGWQFFVRGAERWRALSAAGEGGGMALGIAGFAVFGLSVLLAILYAGVASYLLPISLCAFADEGRLRAAFDPRRLWTVGVSANHAVVWFAVLGAVSGLQVVFSFLLGILIGYLLLPVLPVAAFYLGMAGTHGFAKAYVAETRADDGTATGEGPTSETATRETATAPPTDDG